MYSNHQLSTEKSFSVAQAVLRLSLSTINSNTQPIAIYGDGFHSSRLMIEKNKWKNDYCTANYHPRSKVNKYK